MLANVLEAGLLRRVALDSHDEVAAFAHLSAVVGRGEAASVAFAEASGCSIATDEMRPKLLRLIRDRLGEGRLVRGPELVAQAVAARVVAMDVLAERVATLAVHAGGPFDCDEAEHLTRVLERVRERLRHGGSP